MCFVVHGWVPNTKKSNTRPALPHYSNPPVLPGPGFVELAVTAWGPQVWPCWTAWWLLVPGWDFLYHPGLSSRFFLRNIPMFHGFRERASWFGDRIAQVTRLLWNLGSCRCHGCGELGKFDVAPRFFTLVINTNYLVIRCPRVQGWLVGIPENGIWKNLKADGDSPHFWIAFLSRVGSNFWHFQVQEATRSGSLKESENGGFLYQLRAILGLPADDNHK